ncbi:hypothetical protein AVEN_220213-1 [Araneus ventricosus]|uniref:Uncharacterized protein n=1 Tax=Araneus ventricosus TaxID=182803 RepID=A0A4Y2GZJ0_ARAVE|nr:hypothetical protein AVEN_220213-1 [Araneus ventricosus]
MAAPKIPCTSISNRWQHLNFYTKLSQIQREWQEYRRNFLTMFERLLLTWMQENLLRGDNFKENIICGKVKVSFADVSAQGSSTAEKAFQESHLVNIWCQSEERKASKTNPRFSLLHCEAPIKPCRVRTRESGREDTPAGLLVQRRSKGNWCPITIWFFAPHPIIRGSACAKMVRGLAFFLALILFDLKK